MTRAVVGAIRNSFLVLAALACAPTARAQSDWHHTMLLYVLGAGLDGDMQVGSVDAGVDESFTDILENLDVGGMGSYRAANDRWAHTIDAMFTELSGNTTLASGVRIDAKVDQLIASYDIGYRIAEHFEVLVGARYNSIDTELAVRLPTGAQRGSGEKDWVDPYVGFNSTIPLSDTFALGLRGDIGGFDVGAKLAWQAIVRIDLNFTDAFFGTLGYRMLDTDYEDGSGASYFKYDVAISGPGIGFGWHFR